MGNGGLSAHPTLQGQLSLRSPSAQQGQCFVKTCSDLRGKERSEDRIGLSRDSRVGPEHISVASWL